MLDATDPPRLAAFYTGLLDRAISRVDGLWYEIRLADDLRLCVQHAPEHAPPTWPGHDVPQQVHLDLEVADLEATVEMAVALGATDTGEPARGDPDRARFRVLVDPAGHPFCLCTDAD